MSIMNNTENFYCDLAKRICDNLANYFDGTGISFSERDIPKNNGSVKALVFKKDDSVICPTVYLDNYMDNENLTVNDIVERVTATVYEAFENAPEMPEDVFTREYLEENLFVCVCNYEANREYLLSVPHEKFNDLAVVPRVKVFENGSFVVTNPFLVQAHLTGEELLEIAKKNTLSSENFEKNKISMPCLLHNSFFKLSRFFMTS